MRFTRGNWALEWEDIGEGFNGEYFSIDRNNPHDMPLLRANLLFKGEVVENGSYCTLTKVGTSEDLLRKFAMNLLKQLPSKSDRLSKKVMEEWTWTTATHEECKSCQELAPVESLRHGYCEKCYDPRIETTE